jgi:hypothetical protein
MRGIQNCTTEDDMDIFDYMDCVGCDSYRYHHPTYDDPEEHICTEGAPDDGPCERMTEVIAERICEGEFERSDGYFIDQAWAKTRQADEDESQRFREFDFSSAPYWFIPTEEGKAPVAYKDETEVFEEYFA